MQKFRQLFGLKTLVDQKPFQPKKKSARTKGVVAFFFFFLARSRGLLDLRNRYPVGVVAKQLVFNVVLRSIAVNRSWEACSSDGAFSRSQVDE